MGRIFNGIFLSVQLFVMFLFHFFMEYSRNILHVRPHPKAPAYLKEYSVQIPFQSEQNPNKQE